MYQNLEINKGRRVFSYLQIFLWGFVLFISTSNKVVELTFGTAFLVALATVAHAIWIVYGHVFIALPQLTENRNYFKYTLFLLLIVISGATLIVWVYLNYFPFRGPCRQDGTILSMTVHALIESFFYLVFSTLIKFTYDYFNLQSKHQTLASEKLTAELNYLKLQINPHFLFNTLNNLLFLTQKKSSMAPTVVEKLSHLMRYMLEISRQEKIDLKSEIEFIEAYIELEKLRIKNIEVSLDSNAADHQVSIPPMLLLTLVENAFKHGIDKSVKNYISITILVDEQYVQVTVKNHIVANTAKVWMGDGSGSIGLTNLKKRLNLIYANKYSLDLKNEDDHFEAILKIPI